MPTLQTYKIGLKLKLIITQLQTLSEEKISMLHAIAAELQENVKKNKKVNQHFQLYSICHHAHHHFLLLLY